MKSIAGIFCMMLLISPAVHAQSAGETPDAVQRAWELRMTGNTDEAIAILEQECADHQDNAAAHYELSRCLFYVWRFSSASSHAKRAVELEPGNVAYLRYAGVLLTYRAMDDFRRPLRWVTIPFVFRQGVGFLEQAVERAPGDDELRYRLLELYAGLPWYLGGSGKKARQMQGMLADHDPIWGEIAAFRINRPAPEEMVARYELLGCHHPDSPLLAYFKGMALNRAARYDDAAGAFRDALRLDARFSDGLLLVGKGHDGDPASAERATRAYLETDPAAPMRAYAVLQLSNIARKTGDQARADSLRAEAIGIDRRVWSTYAAPPRELFLAR